MKIGELAKAAHVEAETIRYYERIGLLPAPSRSPNGYRAYAGGHLERLAFIRHCRALDIALVDVAQLLRFVDDPTTDCAEVDALIDTQLTRVRARLDTLQMLERQLVALRSRVDEANTEITRLQHELEQTSELIRHDPLTGVLNRKGLDEALSREAAFAQRRGTPLCLGLLDVDTTARERSLDLSAPCRS